METQLDRGNPLTPLTPMEGFDPALPLAQASTIPASWYVDPAVFRRERERVFRDGWHFLGRAEQLAAPGSYVAADVAGLPVLAVRGEDGTLRAFVNLCRHRAAPLATEGCGVADRFRCRYHGWTYGLDGALRGVPEFDGVEGFDRDGNGLAPLAVRALGRFAWVHSGPAPALLAERLGPFADFPVPPGLRFAERRTYDVACNWKVYVDNYLDGGYHVNTVHPGLAGVLDYAEYRTEVAAEAAVQSSPLRQPDGRWHSTEAAGVRVGDRAHYWWVFPNFMLNLTEGVMDTNLVLPVAPDRCRVVFDYYFAEPADAAFAAESIAVSERIQEEDAAICADVQRGLESGAFGAGRYSVRREAAAHHFHRLLAARLG